MKSLRLSLVFYFLVLLILALGAVSGLVYGTAYQSLLAKEKSTFDLLAARHEARALALREQFDGQLLRRAQTLANLAQSQQGPPYQELYSLGLLTAVLAPNGHFLVPLWLGETVDGPLAYRLHRRSVIHIDYAEAVMPRDKEGHDPVFFQVYNEAGTPLQHSLSLAGRSLRLVPETRDKLGPLDSQFEDMELSPGVSIRQVTLKAPVWRFRVPVGPPLGRRGSPGNRPRTPPPPPTPRKFEDRSLPAIFVQCGGETIERDKGLASLQQDLDNDLVNLRAESSDILGSLRTRLLWVALITLAATMMGGFWLIGVGLSPLRRLSDAVSRVSTKDFRLPLEASQLPWELQPIANRLDQTLDLLGNAFIREKQAAADISHELRTPLAALLTTLEVGLRKPRTPEQYDELLRECRSLGQQMGRLVERLLALARLDAGVDTIHPRTVDLVSLTDKCISQVRPLADTRGLVLAVHSPGLLELTTDADKLREILTNLLHNAIEYNWPGGHVDVTLKRHNGCVIVDVADTGRGISAAARGRVFERFFRADSARHADGIHAGLGLAIVQGYVRLLGGSVAVESEEGKGSTFRVELPFLAEPKKDHFREPSASGSRNQQPLRGATSGRA